MRPPCQCLLPLALAVALGGACSGPGGEAGPAAGGAAPAASRPLVERYLAVAFGNRYGSPPERLRRWQGAVVVRPTGAPRYEDRARLRGLVRQLNPLLQAAHLDLAEWDTRPADLEIRYLPLDRLAEILPAADPSGLARVSLETGADGRLRSALLLLPSDEAVPQYMRENLLLEGLMACLGLAGSVDAQPWDSAFYAPPNWDVFSLHALDLELAALHYRDDLAAGMPRDQVARHLGAPGASGGG